MTQEALAMNLYEELAQQLATQIQNRSLLLGDRLPGTRRLATKHRVSINTVLQAQSLLENWGMISAKPRSGYFVCWRGEDSAEHTIKLTEFNPAPQLVKNQKLVLDLVQNTEDKNLVQFGAALPDSDFFPIKKLQRSASHVIRTQDELYSRYSFPPGDLNLRKQLSKRMHSKNCAVGPEELVITSGCHEAILLALKALTKPGDIVALESPTYYGLLQIIDSLQLKALEIPTSPREGMDQTALTQACKEWDIKACVIVSNFSNPLGCSASLQQKKSILSILTNNNIPLIEDNIYGDLSFDGFQPSTFKSLDTKGNVLYCNSCSKTVSPGLRVGWIAPGRYLEKVTYLKFTQTLATPTLDQQILCRYLMEGNYDQHIRKIRAVLAARIFQIRALILKHFPPGTSVSKPEGGFVLWITMPRKFDSMIFYELALKNKISIAPGPLFTTGNKYKNCFRINCALSWDNKIEQAIEVLGRIAVEFY